MCEVSKYYTVDAINPRKIIWKILETIKQTITHKLYSVFIVFFHILIPCNFYIVLFLVFQFNISHKFFSNITSHSDSGLIHSDTAGALKKQEFELVS